MLATLSLTALFATSLTALPSKTSHPLTVQGLLSIAPVASSCASASFPDECRTASQSLPHILASFTKYNITAPATQAALISLMAYESGEFKYNKNHWPGVIGQGTRNMQSPTYNREYAAALGLGDPEQRDPANVMALVWPDEYSFASAAWFVVSQCPLSVREGMWGGGVEGWESYLTDCVGADLGEEPGRRVYWEKAKTALGL